MFLRRGYSLNKINQSLRNKGIDSKFIKQSIDKIKEDQICLSTIHKSKGLEWSIVFIIGCDDKFFPSSKDDDKIVHAKFLKHHEIFGTKRQIYPVARHWRDISDIFRDFFGRDIMTVFLRDIEDFVLDITTETFDTFP